MCLRLHHFLSKIHIDRFKNPKNFYHMYRTEKNRFILIGAHCFFFKRALKTNPFERPPVFPKYRMTIPSSFSRMYTYKTVHSLSREKQTKTRPSEVRTDRHELK